MKYFTYLTALISLSFVGVASAGEAHVCKSPAVSGTAANPALNDDTVFTCGGGVSGTIPQLAKRAGKLCSKLIRLILLTPPKLMRN
ncbi:hypothetical protein [Serratia marcescens]|uniref:hypothetical protein n=1 Tax=Serratia marcescens TaxID=615 RepID=UPI0020CA878B|nr:hypothetical protein [Serratia marcescens]